MRHLDDDQLAMAVAGLPLEEPVSDHLDSCLHCKGRVTAMRGLIEERRDRLVADAPDWHEQRVRVMSRIEAAATVPSRRRWLRPVLAAAAVLTMAVGVGLLQLPDTGGPEAELAVEEILAETNALLDDDSIPGFEVIDPGIDDLESYLANGVS